MESSVVINRLVLLYGVIIIETPGVIYELPPTSGYGGVPSLLLFNLAKRFQRQIQTVVHRHHRAVTEICFRQSVVWSLRGRVRYLRILICNHGVRIREQRAELVVKTFNGFVVLSTDVEHGDARCFRGA